MDNLFRYDNKFFQILSRTTDIVILNFLFIFSCIPIITVGASITATYSVAMRMVNDDEEYILRTFIRKFKENFKTSTIIWIFMIIVGAVLILDFNISNIIYNKTLSKVLQFILTLVSIIYVFVFTYVFPIISKFENTIKNTIKNSILISIQNLPYTIIMVVLNLSPIILLYWFGSFWGYILFFYLIIGYGIVYCINSIILNSILKKIIYKKSIK